MNYKTGRVNHDFQIAYFQLGACHTADAAYALAKDLLDDRRRALSAAAIANRRTQLRRKEVAAAMEAQPHGSIARERSEIKLDELDQDVAQAEWLVAQAEREADFIEKCIAALQPLRRYAHLPDHEAFEAAQQEEWKLELIHRAENYIGAQGYIPHDELATMRAHPEFETSILPSLDAIAAARRDGKSYLSKAKWRLPLQLAYASPEKRIKAA